MTFALDLTRRALLVAGLVLLSLPLWSLADLTSFRVTFPAAVAVEVLVLAFIVVTGTVGLFDSRLFVASRLFRPALVLGAVVLALGSCQILFQFAGARAAVEAVLGATVRYFDEPSAADLLQPTLAGLEFAALPPLVEIVMRRRARLTRTLAWFLSIVALVTIVASAALLADSSKAVAARLPEIAGAIGELTELWILGLVSSAWLLWAAFAPPLLRSTDRTVRLAAIAAVALMAGVAVLGRSPLGYVAGAVAAVALGLGAALSPSPSVPPGTGSSRWVFWILGACVLVAAPIRAATALWPATVGVRGAGPLQPALEDVMYRVADQQSTWTLAPQARTVTVLMRWDASGASDCYVRITVAGRPNDEVSLAPDRWTPVRFAVPPVGPPHEPPAVTFGVGRPSCRLLVGTITATR